ncbi:formylglycine-generating enzyme family protein [Microcystis aeruginosa CS-1036]|uniref:formylglycine-generating enzyme family protein n=1 Tax=Microcystis aeruginosa TaxID=1126 RepID=UPI00232CB79A|nr:formylglycine-generating enzyme family protein [Microcystis aeruginosa]MDB9543397.1 formylglycine-generating enzyme family protein [Microcystis aeruginosa CS-1036]
MPTIIIQKTQKRLLIYREKLTDDLDIELVKIPSGTFTMGSSEQESSNKSEKPQHNVTLKNFLMGIYPITQAQWLYIAQRKDLKVEQDLNPEPSHFKGSTNPVEMVSWLDAVEFCQRLSKLSKRKYRLPTEAEWEYACRAQTKPLNLDKGETYPPYHFGEILTPDLANYDNNLTKTTPVGQFYANDFGLYDMHGNVWEWCQDDWCENYEEIKKSKKQQNQASKVLRGGSWGDSPYTCRSAFRSNLFRRAFRNDILGFRVVCGAGRTL